MSKLSYLLIFEVDKNTFKEDEIPARVQVSDVVKDQIQEHFRKSQDIELTLAELKLPEGITVRLEEVTPGSVVLGIDNG